MMLATHQMQSSYVAFSSRTLSWSRGIKLNRHVSISQMVPIAGRFMTLKHGFPLRLAIYHTHKVRARRFSISSFKGNTQNDESLNQSSKSKYPKNSARISYIPQDSNSSKLLDVSVSCASQSNEIMSRSQVIRKLFHHWLTLLRTESEEQVGEEIRERPLQELAESEKETHMKERGEVLKAILRYFLGLDAAIKIPLMIFIPIYLAVNLVYGAKVSKELTPLWILGPLVTALYVKLVQAIFALYVFTFKRTLKICKDLPSYYAIAHRYIAEGKLREEAQARVWKPLVNLKNMDLKEVSGKKWEEFREWLNERWIEHVESIWPIYFKLLRFLKTANLI